MKITQKHNDFNVKMKFTFKILKIFMNQTLYNNLSKLGYSETAEYLKKYSASSKDSIPSFYIPAQKQISKLYTTFAAVQGLERFHLKYPSLKEIKDLKAQADKITQPSFSFQSSARYGGKTINYKQYMQLRESSTQCIADFLTSRLFIQLNGGFNSTIPYDELFNYLFTVAYSVPHIKTLLSYDLSNSGVISQENFAKYVAQMADRIYFVEYFTKKNHEFKQYYIQYVVNILFARLDPLGTRMTNISSLLEDKMFTQWTCLDYTLDPDEDDESFKKNVFGPIISKAYVDVFSKINMNHDGIITAEDVMQIPGIRWCRTFAESLISKASPAPNFEWFVRAQFCYDFIGEPWANTFYFDVMDLNGDGVITEEDLAPVYADVSAVYKQVNPGNPLPPLRWIVDEMLDLYGVSNGEISKQLFINSKSTSGFVRHLVDIRGFIKWEGDYDILQPRN